jgi:hypothetical protein
MNGVIRSFNRGKGRISRINFAISWWKSHRTGQNSVFIYDPKNQSLNLRTTERVILLSELEFGTYVHTRTVHTTEHTATQHVHVHTKYVQHTHTAQAGTVHIQ